MEWWNIHQLLFFFDQTVGWIDVHSRDRCVGGLKTLIMGRGLDLALGSLAFLARKMDTSMLAGQSELRSFASSGPAAENTCSDGTEVAGTAMYRRASWAK